MRLFFAIELDALVSEALDQALAPLRGAEPTLAWVAPPRWHLTMKFVGDPSGRAVERLAHAADRAAARHRSFPLILAGVGAFPNFRRARVVWVGVESDPRLELLHHDLELACAEEGFEVEGRAFRPHVTIARVRDPLPIERARPFARAARTIAFSGAQDVRSLTLFDSTATAGAGYRRVHAAPLGGC